MEEAIELSKRDKKNIVYRRSSFEKKASSSVNNIIASCNALNRFTYGSELIYTEEDLNKIFKAVKSAIHDTEKAMRGALSLHKKLEL